MKSLRVLKIVMAFAAAGIAGAANADVILTQTSAGTGNNVQFRNVGPALEIVLSTNGGDDVVFQSNENLVSSSGSSAGLRAEDGTLSLLEFFLQDDTQGLLQVVFNLQGPGTTDVTVNITIWDQLGNNFDFLGQALTGSGENWYEANATDDTIMTRIRIQSVPIDNVDFGFGMRDLQTLRIDETDLPPPNCEDDGSCSPPNCEDDGSCTPVPEPGTLGLLGLGLLGMAARRRRQA